VYRRPVGRMAAWLRLMTVFFYLDLRCSGPMAQWRRSCATSTWLGFLPPSYEHAD
jgi:hypothetical protein